MDTEKISKLAFRLSLPMILSMISMGIYNIIDTIFVSKISNEALMAISLVFPIQIMVSAIGLGTGIGINSLLSKSIGAKENKATKSIIANSIIIGIISYFFVILVFNKNTLLLFFYYFTQNEKVVTLGMDYISIIILFSIINIFQSICSKILEAHGKAKQSMICQFTGIIVNLVLDPILIFGINNTFSFGIEGAAVATVAGRFAGIIISGVFIHKTKDILLPKFKEIKIEISTIINIYKVGLPTIILESVAPIITIILNNILIKYSGDAVSFYGIYYKTQSFIFMVISGLNCGMIPIIGYNLGAKKYNRVKETIKLFLKVSLVIGIFGTIAFAVFPKTILSIFEINDNILQIGIKGFRILSIGFIFAAESFVISAVFQAIGDGFTSLTIFIMRKAFIPILFIIVFKNSMGLESVWYAFTIGEIIAFAMAVLFMLKKKINLKKRTI